MKFLPSKAQRAAKVIAALTMSGALVLGAVSPAAAAEQEVPEVAVTSAAAGEWTGDASSLEIHFREINKLRTSKGLQPLRIGLNATMVAQEWADHLASTQIDEASNFSKDKRVAGWTAASENRAHGPAASSPVQWWMQFEDEAANMLRPGDNVIGLGTIGPPFSVAVANFYQYGTMPEKTFATVDGFLAEVRPQPVFTDVPKGMQFENEIGWIGDQGIATGYPDGTYRPFDEISREAMAAFLWRLSGKQDQPVTVPFNDVSPLNPYRGAIAWLAQTGITTGYPDGSFKPYNSVNRDAMAAYLYRAAGSPSFTPPKKSPFTDVSTSNQFYKEIAWLASTGVSTGWVHANGSRTFAPLAPVKRDAMAAFLYRFVQEGYIER